MNIGKTIFRMTLVIGPLSGDSGAGDSFDGDAGGRFDRFTQPAGGPHST